MPTPASSRQAPAAVAGDTGAAPAPAAASVVPDRVEDWTQNYAYVKRDMVWLLGTSAILFAIIAAARFVL